MSEDGAAESPADGSRASGGQHRPAGDQEGEPQRLKRVSYGPVVVDVVDRCGTGDGSGGSGREPLDLDRWGELAAAAALGEGVRGPAELGLAFVAEAEIVELAARWLRSDHETDVLAFPVEESLPRPVRGASGEGPPLLIGDVVVCPPVAARQAAEAGRALADELALLIVHGVLHLLGHDHAGPIETLRMKRRTRILLARLHRPDRIRVGAPGAASRPAG